MKKFDIVVDVESPKFVQCDKCGFKTYHHLSLKIGRILFHVLDKLRKVDIITMSANINNEVHAEHIKQMLSYIGVECIDIESENLEGLEHPVKVYTFEKLSLLKEIRRDLR